MKSKNINAVLITGLGMACAAGAGTPVVTTRDPSSFDWDEDALVYLGEFRNPGDPGTVGLKCAELTNFINDDSNGVVTIMLQGSMHSSTSASRDCPEGLPAPALELLFAE